MKRFLALSLVLGVTSFGLIGCGEEAAKDEKPADATAAPADPGAEAPKTDGAEAPAPAPTDAPPAVEPPK